MRRRTTKSAVSSSSTTPSSPPTSSRTVGFVGRVREQAELREHLAVASLVVVHGPIGAGKTRLVRHLAGQLEVPVVHVRAYPGDRGAALRARAERALRCLPGGMADALATGVHLVVLDDTHHLSDDELATCLEVMVPPSPALGRVVVIAREQPPLPRAIDRAELAVGGLDDLAARELWNGLEETWGPTKQGAFDAAMTRTRGMPLALRREWAKAALGADAWDVATLPEASRRALEALVVLRMPAAPAAVAALCPGVDVDAALDDLVRRQLVDVMAGGFHQIHDVVHDEVLAAMAIEQRVALARAAAALVAGTGKRHGGRRPAWEAGDDGALGHLDPVDRLREVVLHLLAAGDVAGAVAELAARREVCARRGASGEIESLLWAVGPGADPLVRVMRVELAARAGRIAEAAELAVMRGGPADPVLTAELTLAGGDVAGAVRELMALVDPPAPPIGVPVSIDDRARATAALARLEVLRGNLHRATELVAAAFDDDRGTGTELARSSLYLAQAHADEHEGRIAAACVALGRAQGAFRAGGLTGVAAIEMNARIEARRARCLARQGRLGEAQTALDAAEASAREVDAVAVADELRRSRAQVAMRRGDTNAAVAIARSLVASRRARGDELAALISEVELAEMLVRRGEVVAAAELASAVHGSASRRKLGLLVARAELAMATIDLLEYRVDAAQVTLERLAASPSLDAGSRAQAAVLAAEARAMLGLRAGCVEEARDAGAEEVRDDLDRELAVARVAQAAGDVGVALESSRRAAQRAERAGRGADLAEALVVTARVELARGERAGAKAAATRAAREAATAGLVRVRIQALLALAALARDDEDYPAAAAYARDAADLAGAAGLPVERMAANAALDSIAGAPARPDPASGAAATLSPAALDAVGRLLADLGLTALRPYRLVSADGSVSEVSDADPEILRLPDRALAVDGVRETIWRQGTELADLRRRSLLRRLLFLFAAAPGKVFSKEEIVQTVWDVEYHPLRHDAALFTNIMRIRRLLGEDGAEIIRVTEDGYRFVPPRDFVFVYAV